MRNGRTFACVAGIIGAIAAASGRAGANDSNAALAAGGLVPAQSTTIAMLSEDLTISTKLVRVVYRFKNLSSDPQRVLVKFPFAKSAIDGDAEFETPWKDPARIFNFHVKVDGAAVEPRYETRAITADGADITEELARRGLSPFDPPPAGVKPWSVHYAAFWTQDYAPGAVVVVEHDYRPIAGHAYDPPPAAERRTRYCISPPAERALARAELGSQPVAQANVKYVLVSAKTWAGPIGDFWLSIDEEIAGDMVALCGFPLRAVSPTRLSLNMKNFTPTRDLDILFLEPLAPRIGGGARVERE